MLRLIDEHRGSGDTGIYPPIRIFSGVRGRPAYYIPQSQIEAVMELQFTYELMARLLLIPTRTLQRCRQDYGLPFGRNYTDIIDYELDDTITSSVSFRGGEALGFPPPSDQFPPPKILRKFN